MLRNLKVAVAKALDPPPLVPTDGLQEFSLTTITKLCAAKQSPKLGVLSPALSCPSSSLLPRGCHTVTTRGHCAGVLALCLVPIASLEPI